MDHDIKIICLLTMLRGGSKLLHSLFDNHSQIICFPRTFQYSIFWKKIKNYSTDYQKIANEFVADYPRFFSGMEWYRYNRYDKADRLGESQNETFTIDTDFFKKSFCDLMVNSSSDRKNIFLNLHYAFHLATKKTLPVNGVILYHVHTHDFYDDIDLCIEDFSAQTQLLLCLRHPLQGIRSCFNWTNMHNSFGAGQLYHYQTNIYEMGYVLSIKYPHNNLKIIPLEQIKNDAQKIMSEIAKKFGLKWEDTLLQVTIQGKLWYGNTLKPLKGISNKIMPFSPQNLFENKDWKILSYFFNKRLSLYRYSPLKIKKNFLNDIIFTLGILLPTTIEVEGLIQSLRPSHFYSLIKMTHEEIADPRLLNFDYARKKYIDRKTLLYRLGTYFFRLRLAGPFPFLYYYPRRVFFMFRFLLKYQEKFEPVLFLEK